MSMELLAAPHLAQPVGYFTAGGRRSRAGSSISRTCCISLAHIASVDAFQTWIYTSGEGDDAAARDAAWLRIRERLRARGGLERAGAGAGGALVPPAAHLPVPVLLHRVRHRPDRRAAGLAQQPARLRAARCARYREALALGATAAAARASTAAAGARLTFDAADRRSGAAGRGQDRASRSGARLRAALSADLRGCFRGSGGNMHRCSGRGRFPAGRSAPARRVDWMAKEEGIEMEGVVTEVLPDRNYRVLLENGHEILAYAAGKMSKFKIRVLEGDRVSVVLSPYDLTRGRVIYRHK